jgi:hypothetical protein
MELYLLKDFVVYFISYWLPAVFFYYIDVVSPSSRPWRRIDEVDLKALRKQYKDTAPTILFNQICIQLPSLCFTTWYLYKVEGLDDRGLTQNIINFIAGNVSDILQYRILPETLYTISLNSNAN